MRRTLKAFQTNTSNHLFLLGQVQRSWLILLHNVDNIFQTAPLQALNHIRNSLENIGKSRSVSDQLSRYAIKCHEYSMKPKFKKTFEKLYAVKRGRAQDSLLNKKSSALYFKAIDSAVDITDRPLDIVKESTLEKMDAPEHSTMGDTGQNELKNRVKL